jgi:hypothetical protein
MMVQADTADNKEKPILFLSKTLIASERNYWPMEPEHRTVHHSSIMIDRQFGEKLGQDLFQVQPARTQIVITGLDVDGAFRILAVDRCTCIFVQA